MNEKTTLEERIEELEAENKRIKYQIGVELKGKEYKEARHRNAQLKKPEVILEELIKYPPLIEIDFPTNGYVTGDLLKFAKELQKKQTQTIYDMYYTKNYKGTIKGDSITKDEEIDNTIKAIIVREIQIRKYKVDRKEYI